MNRRTFISGLLALPVVAKAKMSTALERPEFVESLSVLHHSNEVFRIDSRGNLHLGTKAPNTTLDVQKRDGVFVRYSDEKESPAEPDNLISEEERITEALDLEHRRVMDGGDHHEVFVKTEVWWRGQSKLVQPAVVGMTNQSDPAYAQYFRDRTELQAFIDKLNEAADEAWGTQP